MRLIKEVTATRGVVRRIVVMKDKKDDELTTEKEANVDGDDEESGKDDGTEGANQVKSSYKLNVDGDKEQSGKEGATKVSCEKDISAETEESKRNVDGVDEHDDGDNVVGENC